MRFLWTFEDQAKLDKFTAILADHEIAYEINSKSTEDKTNQLTISVEEADYENSKKLLMRHRKRKASK
ncbi:MAG: hypothetical protein ACOYM2_09220 [Rectinemataceae bacterium]